MLQLIPSSPQLIMIAAMGIMIWILWRRSHRHFGRGGAAYEPLYRSPKLKTDRDTALIDAPPEISRWQVEMYELSREMKGELDTKMAALQILTRQANEAIQRLERATALVTPARAGGPLEAIEAWDTQSHPSPIIESRQHPHAAQIYALADEGHSPTAIAEKTGLSMGDIEMTLSLRNPD